MASRHPASPLLMGSKTTIEAEAPYAVEQARGALEGVGIEDDDRTIEKIEVTVHFGDGTETEPETDARTVKVQPDVMPLSDSDDLDLTRWEFPPGPPERLNANTHFHVLVVVMANMAEQHGSDEAFTVEDITTDPGCPLSKPQVTSALTDLYNKKGLALRRRANGAYEYLVTEELRSEADRLGTYDLDAIAGVE